MSNELSLFIDECFKESLKAQKDKASLAGEPVKTIFNKVKIKNNTIHLECEVVGYTGEKYDSYNLNFSSVIYPYYYLEVLRLALISYWSGNLISKKDKKRLLFVLEYGESNKFYLNRSLKYLYFVKKCLRLI
ncbi:hypothetical protein [Bacillus toyonensis]|uniref:hypothetical protein n=1 Tax=Bacillus toyonensis TaxID=155322 RepID=UPI002E1CB115|nr:hypothetical protein [Bacillus toyonensis]